MRTLITGAAALLISAAPASAQLLGGGIGIGGALGGALPGGMIQGTLGARGGLDVPVRAPLPAVAVPVVGAPRVPVPTTVVTNVRLPVVPNLEVRRTALIAAGIAPVAIAEVPAYVQDQYVVLSQDLRGSGVEVVRRDNQIVLEMPADVTSAFDRYDIQPRFRGALDAVSHTLSRYPAMFVDVNGHTDAIGSYAYNQRLSEHRADAVADYLATRQVTPARMRVQGFGKTEPVASNATIAGRAANRRVEIVLTPYAA